MNLPGETKLFGTAMGRIRDPKEVDFVVLNEFDRLILVNSEGKTVYTSRDHLAEPTFSTTPIRKETLSTGLQTMYPRGFLSGEGSS